MLGLSQPKLVIDSWRDLGFYPGEALSDKYFVNGASKIVNNFSTVDWYFRAAW